MSTTTRYETIDWSVADRIGTLTINRPAHHNGITNQMMRELREHLEHVAVDDSVSVVVVTGAGSTFCPGADLKHYSSGEPDEPSSPDNFRIPVLLHDMSKITIAAINGACAGAGLGWACACDLRYAAAGAKLNTAFLDVALAGDMGLPWTLPQIVGAGTARELSFLPGRVVAEDAKAIGLVNGVFDTADLMDEVMHRARRLAASSPRAIEAMKAHYLSAPGMTFAEFIAHETAVHQRLAGSADTKEAFLAFVEKRPPRFSGT